MDFNALFNRIREIDENIVETTQQYKLQVIDNVNLDTRKGQATATGYLYDADDNETEVQLEIDWSPAERDSMSGPGQDSSAEVTRIIGPAGEIPLESVAIDNDEVTIAVDDAAADSRLPYEEDVEKEIDECGAMPVGEIPSESQKDNVSMNVTMSGSGAGGIRDLLDALRSIDGNKAPTDPGMVVDVSPEDEGVTGAVAGGIAGAAMTKSAAGAATGAQIGSEIQDKLSGEKEESFANSPDEKITDLPTTGSDMHRPKQSFSSKPYRGDNPMAEELVTRLTQHYEQVKEGEQGDVRRKLGNRLGALNKKIGQLAKSQGRTGLGMDGQKSKSDAATIAKQMGPAGRADTLQVFANNPKVRSANRPK